METKLTVQDEICQTLSKRQADFKMALPKQIPSEKFIRVAQTAIRQNPNLANPEKVERTSLYAAFHDAAAKGLLPDGREGVIVPFKGKARFMPMIAGLMKLAKNSGEIKSTGAEVVHEKDTYEHWIDETGEHFKFVKSRGDRGEMVLTFAFAMTKDGGLYFEEIDTEEMKAIESMSRADDSPWKGKFKTEMMKKSAYRRLLKYRVPSSTDIDETVRMDDDMYEKDTAPEPPKPAETTSSRLRDAVTTTTVEAPDNSDDVAAREELPL